MNAFSQNLFRLRGGWFNEPTEALGDLFAVLDRVTNPVVGIIASPLDDDQTCTEQDNLAGRLSAEGIHWLSLTDSNRDRPTAERAQHLADHCNVFAMLGGNVAETRERWRDADIDPIITARVTDPDRPVAVVGSSLGSGTWFRSICTRDRRLQEPKGNASHWIRGLDIFPARVALHYNGRHRGTPHATAFMDLLGSEPIDVIGLGIDPQLAVEIQGDVVRIVGTDRYAAVDRLERVAPGREDGTTGRAGLNLKTYERGAKIPYDEFFLSAGMRALQAR